MVYPPTDIMIVAKCVLEQRLLLQPIESRISSPSGVWGGAQTDNEFGVF